MYTFVISKCSRAPNKHKFIKENVFLHLKLLSFPVGVFSFAYTWNFWGQIVKEDLINNNLIIDDAYALVQYVTDFLEHLGGRLYQ